MRHIATDVANSGMLRSVPSLPPSEIPALPTHPLPGVHLDGNRIIKAAHGVTMHLRREVHIDIFIEAVFSQLCACHTHSIDALHRTFPVMRLSITPMHVRIFIVIAECGTTVWTEMCAVIDK